MSRSCARSCKYRRHLRRQHAERQPARRRSTSRSAGPAITSATRRRRTSRTLGTRCEIKNMNSMRFIQAAIEYEARRQIANSRRRRQHRSGNPPLRPRQGRNPLDRLEGRGARTTATSPTQTFCPSTSNRPGSTRSRRACPSYPDEEEGPLHGRLRPHDYDASVLTAETAAAAYFEAVAGRPRRQGGGELGHQRALRAAEKGRPFHRRDLGDAVPARRHPRPHREKKATFPARSPRTSSRSSNSRGRRPRRNRRDPAACGRSPTQAPFEAAVDEIIAANPAQVEKAKANPKLSGWFGPAR